MNSIHMTLGGIHFENMSAELANEIIRRLSEAVASIEPHHWNRCPDCGMLTRNCPVEERRQASMN